MWITVIGDKLVFEGDSDSLAVYMLDIKLLFNSVISDTSECIPFCCAILKDMFLCASMRSP